EGRVILYADKITGSLDRALRETERRRKKQEEHNILHNIVLKTIIKPISNTLSNTLQEKAIAEPKVNTNKDDLRKQMIEHAENLEFEEAAKIKKLLQG
ncbi:MAG: UvrB/UvrC motif-containing protein, partial [Wolbachia pipientis]